MKSHTLSFSAAALLCGLSALAPCFAEEPKPGTVPAEVATDTRGAGAKHVALLTAQPWGAPWKNAVLSGERIVGLREGKPRGGQPARIWHAKVTTPDGTTGYVMWNAEGAGELVEFTLDSAAELKGEGLRVIRGVPPQQQFPVTDKDGGRIASGCVPTTGGSVLGFWIANGQPAWRGKADAADPVPDLTKRLRARLDMTAFPDTSGYTEDGLTLAGTNPAGLAKAIEADAAEHGVKVAVKFGAFRFDEYRGEINAGRPVPLSCVVRLPHKPDLSWGHEIAGVGQAEIGGAKFVGVSDNFFPVRHPETVRWIAAEAMQTMILLRPGEASAAGK